MSSVETGLRASVIVLLPLVACIGCRCSGQQETRLQIDPTVRHQVIEGFGTSVDTWTPSLTDFYEKEEFVRDYVHELGLDVLRVDLWHGVAPERERWEDISYLDFQLDGPARRGGLYVEVAEKLLAASHGQLKVIGSVWSPPGWMKENRSHRNGHPERRNFALALTDLGGGDDRSPRDANHRYLGSNRLRPERYRHFGKFLVEWTRLYRSRGIELYGLSPQNEPRFSHWFGSAVYTPAELANVVEVIVSTFELEGEPLPRLFAPETMTHDNEGNRLYLNAMMARPNVFARLSAFASHGYLDGYKVDRDPASPERFWDLVGGYGKPVWVTEGGTGGHEWPAPVHGLGAALSNALGAGHASLITTWMFVQPSDNEHSLRGLTGATKKTRVAQHFSRFIRPGMQRVEIVGASHDLLATAYEDVRLGRFVVVLVNRGLERRAIRVTPKSEGAYDVVEARITDRQRDFAPVGATRRGAFELPGEAVATLILERATRR